MTTTAFQETPYHVAIRNGILADKKHKGVMAGPGSGKTTTGKLIIVPAVIASGLTSGAAMTFNTKNASDLKDAFAAFPGVQCGTIHSLVLKAIKAVWPGVRVVVKKEAGKRMGPKGFRFYPAEKGKLDLIGEGEAYGEEKSGEIEAGKRLVSLAKAAGFGLPNFPSVTDAEAWKTLAKQHGQQEAETLDNVVRIAQSIFAASVRDTSTMDFDDYLYFLLFYNLPLPVWQFIFYDEAQDATPIVIEFLRRMALQGTRILYVGDEKQNINVFMGAVSGAMRKLQEILDADVYPLPVSYRCSKAAADLANEVFPDSVIAADGNAQGSVEYIEESALDCCNLITGEAVLSRTHKLLITGALQLIKARKSFCYKGIAATVQRMERQLWIAKAAGKETGATSLSDIARELLARQETLEAKHTTPGKNPPPWVQVCRDTTEALVTVLIETATDGGNIDTVSDYLSTLGKAENGKSGPTLSTLHASKGAEFNTVYILGPMVSPLAVTPEELDAEKCLKFVGLTRSKDKIVFVTPSPKKAAKAGQEGEDSGEA